MAARTSLGAYLLTRYTELFPLWILAGTVLALLYPPLFTWFTGPLITVGLGFIMLGMGLTLTIEDFQRVLKTPQRILLGVFFQFLIMPSLGWSIAHAFNLPAPFAGGLILVASCPSGTASNVVTFLAKRGPSSESFESVIRDS